MYIYLHLPFCSSICSYCDFPKVLYDKKFVDRYLDCLKKEIKSRYQGEDVKSIFIGGGTPTCLDLEELEKLLKLTKLFHYSDLKEFTIESNIESLSYEKILLLKKYGVNRISLGVQSFQDDVLRELNRHHNKKMVVDVVHDIRNVGIYNISIDYIYGVDSNIHGIQEDLETILELDIPHVSCYSLIIENGTMLKIRGKKNIDDETEKEMYLLIEDTLRKAGYHHYEISNYAKVGYESLHNLNYWNNLDYYGFGLGAVSYLGFYRRNNTKNLSHYLNNNYLDSEEYEDEMVRISNELILGLRKIDGISLHKFYEKYKRDVLEIFDIKELLLLGMLVIEGDFLKISQEYIYVSNEILLHFV